MLPLAGAAINGFFGKRFSRRGERGRAVFQRRGFRRCLCGSLFAILIRWRCPSSTRALDSHQRKLSAPTSRFYLDQLSLVMLLVVTGRGLSHPHLLGRLHVGRSGYYRFFSYLNLFMFFMLTLILASNYLLMFIGWEGVGLASYLLIGFWFTKDSAASAGKKAFIVNRIGDFGFLIALFLLIKHFGSLNFDQVFAGISPMGTETGGAGLLTAIGILLMVGACGKSAQIPLYVWLPDAMEGPTPVSALIHAATMVTAGVYMVSRSHMIFERAPTALTGGRDHRHADCIFRRHHRHRANRHQESPRVLDRLAAGIHVHGVRRGRVLRRHLPSDDARLLQRPAVPGVQAR
jgi:NADH-quinone oxidoreductase subunit L